MAKNGWEGYNAVAEKLNAKWVEAKSINFKMLNADSIDQWVSLEFELSRTMSDIVALNAKANRLLRNIKEQEVA